MQDGTFKQRKGRNETGYSLASTFITEARKARILQSQQSCTYTVEAREQTQSYNRLIFLHSHTYTVLLDGQGATNTHTKARKEKKRSDFPYGPSNPLSHDRRHGRAWLRPPRRPAKPLRHPSSGRAGPPQAALRRIPSASPPTGRAGPRARERARRKGALNQEEEKGE